MRRRLATTAVALAAAISSASITPAIGVEIVPNHAVASISDIKVGDIHLALQPSNPYNDKPSRSAQFVPVGLKRLDYDLSNPDDARKVQDNTLTEIVAESFDKPFYLLATTDVRGELTWHDVPAGMYVVMSPLADADFHPLAISVPSWNSTFSQWQARADVRPKMRPSESQHVPPTTPAPASLEKIPESEPPVAQNREPGALGLSKKPVGEGWQLASTGASVIGIITAAIALLLIGGLALRLKRKN